MWNSVPVLFLILLTNTVVVSGAEDIISDAELKRIHGLIVNLTATPPPTPISQQECAEYCKEVLCARFSLSQAASSNDRDFDSMHQSFNDGMRKTLRCFEAQKVCVCRPTTPNPKPEPEEPLDCTYCHKECSDMEDWDTRRKCRHANTYCVCGPPQTQPNQNWDNVETETKKPCTGRGCETNISLIWSFTTIVVINLIIVVFCVTLRNRHRLCYRGNNVNRSGQDGGFLPVVAPTPVVLEPQAPYNPYAAPAYARPCFPQDPRMAIPLLPTNNVQPSAPIPEASRENEDLPPPYNYIYPVNKQVPP